MNSEGVVCLANISPQERQKRLTFGVMAFLVAIVVLAVMLVADLNLWWRMILFAPFMGAALGYFQWRDQTCIGLVARNERKLGDQVETIQDESELAQLRRQARQVQLKAVIAALVLTVATFLLP
jgi:hypothetical protein